MQGAAGIEFSLSAEVKGFGPIDGQAQLASNKRAHSVNPPDAKWLSSERLWEGKG